MSVLPVHVHVLRITGCTWSFFECAYHERRSIRWIIPLLVAWGATAARLLGSSRYVAGVAGLAPDFPGSRGVRLIGFAACVYTPEKGKLVAPGCPRHQQDEGIGRLRLLQPLPGAAQVQILCVQGR